MLGRWRWCIRGAQVAAHRLWRGVGGALRHAGRWLRRYWQHVSGTMEEALLGRWSLAAVTSSAVTAEAEAIYQGANNDWSHKAFAIQAP